jgi:hypothetical protein
MPQPVYAVIAGELAEAKKVSHTHLGKIPDILRESVSQVNKNLPRQQHFDYETIRMDEFLCISEDPVSAMQALILLASDFRYRSYLQLNIRLDLRLSLGIAAVELLKKNLRESDGTAFRIADENLRAMKRNQRLIIMTDHEDINEEFSVACGFMDILIHDWSDEQAEALFMRLAGKNQMEISKELDISQPAVNRRLKAAHFEAIEGFIKRYEAVISRYISK